MVVGGVAAVVAAFYLMGWIVFGNDGTPWRTSCDGAVTALVVTAGALVLAWLLVFRVKERSFVLGFARAFVLGVALLSAIPWPCSVTGASIASLQVCGSARRR